MSSLVVIALAADAAAVDAAVVAVTGGELGNLGVPLSPSGSAPASHYAGAWADEPEGARDAAIAAGATVGDDWTATLDAAGLARIVTRPPWAL